MAANIDNQPQQCCHTDSYRLKICTMLLFHLVMFSNPEFVNQHSTAGWNSVHK
jgi:hypothetical protein